jgi:hypothetical protein
VRIGLIDAKSPAVNGPCEGGVVKTKSVIVTVEDTGIGISDENKKKLFQAFQQAQRRAGGTGLGLFSLAKRIEALKGTFGVRDRDDGEQGSCFWFTFPYRPDIVASAGGETAVVSVRRSVDAADAADSAPRVKFSEGMLYHTARTFTAVSYP